MDTRTSSLDPVDWPEAKPTGNAHLLAGYIAARLSEVPRDYEIAALGNPLILKNRNTGNRFSVSVQQIAGSE